MGMLSKRFSRRRGGSSSGVSLDTPVAIALMFLVLIPSLPDVVPTGDVDIPQLCSCGCGKVKGKCCCAAPRTTRLEFGCSNSEDPNDPLDGASSGKIIGPPERIGLVLPVPSVADLADPVFVFAGLDPLPEIPPPRI